jgi:hypothetical protein
MATAIPATPIPINSQPHHGTPSPSDASAVVEAGATTTFVTVVLSWVTVVVRVAVTVRAGAVTVGVLAGSVAVRSGTVTVGAVRLAVGDEPVPTCAAAVDAIVRACSATVPAPPDPQELAATETATPARRATDILTLVLRTVSASSCGSR